jgi:hypothetical protein
MSEKLDKAKQAGQGAIKGAVGENAAKAEGLVKGGLENAFNGGAAAIKQLLNGLKDSLGIPDLPKIPKKPAFPQLKKFKPKTPPKPPIYQKEEKKFDYAPAPAVQKPVPPPKPPEDPRANFVEEYKGYKIYLRANLPNFYMESRFNDGEVSFKGPESRSATKEELLAYQKKVIDEAIAGKSKGKVAYKYEWDGKRIDVGLYEGDRYVGPVGAFTFKGKVTEGRAVELFIENYKNEEPNLVSWGMQKLSK